MLLPLVQLPPAGYWNDPRRASFVVDPRPLPEPADAASLVLRRYLAAFGPASRRDVAAWAGVAQRDFAEALDAPAHGLLPRRAGHRAARPPRPAAAAASTPLPVRLLAHWDQPLLAYADRERIMAPEVQALKLTLSGDPTVTVGGRVAASWQLRREDDAVRLEVTPHVELRRVGPRGDPRRGRAHGARLRAGRAQLRGDRRVANLVRRSCEHTFVMYAELHCHSAFSFLDGASLPDELAAAAHALGYEAMALTDHNSVSGSMEFAQAAGALGLRAIHGAEVDLDDGRHLTLLVEDTAGWRNLCRILSRAHAHTRDPA